jgi:hypothetical protein
MQNDETLQPAPKYFPSNRPVSSSARVSSGVHSCGRTVPMPGVPGIFSPAAGVQLV